MKIKTQKSKKKLAAVIAAILLLLSVGSIVYFMKLWPFKSSNTSINMKPATKEQQETGRAIKQTSNNASIENKPSGSDQPSPPVSQPNGKSIIAISITAANQNSNTLQIRSLIEATVSDGTCTLTLTKPGYASLVKTANVHPLASSSTCQGFDIATSELARGIWNINLVFENSSLRGETSKSVDIQ